MTNKQAYAGLLERLAVGVTWSDGKPIGAVVGEVNDPVMREAAEAISSLLKALTGLVEANIKRGPFDEPLGSSEQTPEMNAAIAALNSDAPLSIGEGDRG